MFHQFNFKAMVHEYPSPSIDQPIEYYHSMMKGKTKSQESKTAPSRISVSVSTAQVQWQCLRAIARIHILGSSRRFLQSMGPLLKEKCWTFWASAIRSQHTVRTGPCWYGCGGSLDGTHDVSQGGKQL